MGFRTVIVNSRAKLEFRLNFMIVRGENEKRIFIDEINTLIVQSTAVSLTAALLSELIRSGVKVIFCDEKFNPCSELVPYYGAHNTSKRYKIQMQWIKETKNEIWRRIIAQKITNQKKLSAKTWVYRRSRAYRELYSRYSAGRHHQPRGAFGKSLFQLPDALRCFPKRRRIFKRLP